MGFIVMAIQLVGSNLNNWGNKGQFETDSSTWGFGSDSYRTVARNGAYRSAGSYCASVQIKDTNAGFFFSLVPCSGIPTVGGKKYIARAKVRCNSNNPVAEPNVIVRIDKVNHYGISNVVYTKQKLISEIADSQAANNWFDIETTFDAPFDGPIGGLEVALILNALDNNANNVFLNGVLFIDQLEVYEYVVVPDNPDPDPEPEQPVESAFFSKNPIVFTVPALANYQNITNYRLYCDTRIEEIVDSGKAEICRHLFRQNAV